MGGAKEGGREVEEKKVVRKESKFGRSMDGRWEKRLGERVSPPVCPPH